MYVILCGTVPYIAYIKCKYYAFPTKIYQSVQTVISQMCPFSYIVTMYCAFHYIENEGLSSKIACTHIEGFYSYSTTLQGIYNLRSKFA